RMSKIQYRPQAALALILRDDLRLDAAADIQRVAQRLRIERKQLLRMALTPAHKRFIPNEPMLDHFRQACLHFSLGQRTERRKVKQHEFGLMERTDNIFRIRMVDGYLAANSAV